MSIERLLSYPLAILGSLALITPASEVGTGMRGTEGAPASVSWRESSLGAGARPTKSSVGRIGAESAELRALRAAEGALFPELGNSNRDQRDAAAVSSGSCESPDYEFSKSASVDVTPAGEWLRGLARPDIAVPRDPRVARYIRYFGADPKGRESFSKWLRRYGAYRDIVTSALAKRNLPPDLVALMFIESGCIPKATSIVGAAGLWQFMPQTAQAYGLTVQERYDERRNIWRSTEAAVAHLADLYAQFESWHLAMAAYNMGYQQLLDRLKDTGAEDFFSLSNFAEALPRETLLYVPKVLAVAVILRNLEYFGFDGVEKLPAISAVRLEVPPRTRLTLIARAAGTSLRKIEDLNPQIIGEAVPDIGAPVYVYLPSHGAARAKAMLPRLLEEQNQHPIDLKVTADFDWGREEFDADWRSRLERTAPIAKADDPKAPGAKSKTNVWQQGGNEAASAGRILDGRGAARWGFVSDAEAAMSRKDEAMFYRVKRGDTLAKVAAQFKLTTRELARANGIRATARIRAGAKLKIVPPEGA